MGREHYNPGPLVTWERVNAAAQAAQLAGKLKMAREVPPGAYWVGDYGELFGKGSVLFYTDTPHVDASGRPRQRLHYIDDPRDPQGYDHHTEMDWSPGRVDSNSNRFTILIPETENEYGEIHP